MSPRTTDAVDSLTAAPEPASTNFEPRHAELGETE